MTAEIITVSREILLGEELNTSTKYISKELSALGIDIFTSRVTDYNKTRLSVLFEDALKKSDIVVILGGLGVYKSNLTKDVVSNYFNEPLSFNQNMYLSLVDNLKNEDRYDAKVTRALLSEAYVLHNSINLVCKYSTTSGFIYNSKDNKHVICLPLENKELISMYLGNVKPYLKPRVTYFFESYTFELKNSQDVDLFKLLESEILNSNPKVTLKPLANSQLVELTVKARTVLDAKLILDKLVEKYKIILKDYL